MFPNIEMNSLWLIAIICFSLISIIFSSLVWIFSKETRQDFKDACIVNDALSSDIQRLETDKIRLQGQVIHLERSLSISIKKFNDLIQELEPQKKEVLNG